VLFHKGIPNIRTAPAIRQTIIRLLAEDCAARNKAGYTIVDLGSGNGLMTREIARALPQAKVIGIEITPQSVLWSNWRRKLAKLDNLEYQCLDFFAYDFSQADAIVMYLLPPVMDALGKKLHSEARNCALILSNKFPLGDGWHAEQTLHVKTLYPHQGTLYMYRA